MENACDNILCVVLEPIHCDLQLDLKVEVFSLGPLSQMVGKLVTDLAMPTTLEHGAQRKSAGLLLVDRTLDLITPTCHSDAVIDRIVDSLLCRYEHFSHFITCIHDVQFIQHLPYLCT